MGKVANILNPPCSAIRQAWKDYKVGRMMRKSEKKEVEQLECKLECKENEPPTQPTKSSPKKGWQFNRMAEFPWCLEQIVQEESNWRGTWILEVKDMQGMNWETERVPKESGRGGTYQRMPTKHLPFTPERQQDDSIVLSCGGQDDLMVWLGKR